MNLHTLIESTRTCRRFQQSKHLSMETLTSLIELARLGGSARNCQPWQYSLINDQATCDALFPYLGWAGYLTDWKGPEEGERPSAYILCLLNQNWLKGPMREAYFDLGVATQNLLLGAKEKEILGCRIGAFSPQASSLFPLPTHLSLELIIALGSPAEEIRIEEMGGDDEVKYWRDENQLHHVPKRALTDIIYHLDPAAKVE